MAKTQTREKDLSNKISTLLIAAFLGLTTITLAACGSDEGPAEKAGKKIDKTTDKASDKADEMKDKAKVKSDQMKEKADD